MASNMGIFQTTNNLLWPSRQPQPESHGAVSLQMFPGTIKTVQILAGASTGHVSHAATFDTTSEIKPTVLLKMRRVQAPLAVLPCCGCPGWRWQNQQRVVWDKGTNDWGRVCRHQHSQGWSPCRRQHVQDVQFGGGSRTASGVHSVHPQRSRVLKGVILDLEGELLLGVVVVVHNHLHSDVWVFLQDSY